MKRKRYTQDFKERLVKRSHGLCLQWFFVILWNFQLQQSGFLSFNFLYFYLTTNNYYFPKSVFISCAISSCNDIVSRTPDLRIMYGSVH